jgi:hypothetical protein
MRISSRTTLIVFALLAIVGRTAHAQSLTATIAGRATDASGGLLPGVAVTITSPAMIGGERTTVTDAEGVYRLTLLPPGEYRVVFALSGFATLTVDRVLVAVGSTMTINGKLELAGLETSLTVVSQTPAIDVKATDIATNWDQKKLEDLPYARGIRGLALLLPGLTSTQFDVGGNTVGGSTTTGANSYGRTGDELAKYDGTVWDQHFGDYDSYEQVQASTAAKGAEAQTPGLALNFLVKSGSNTFHGTYLGAYESGAFQGSNITPELLKRGYVPGNNQFSRYDDLHADLGGPIIHDKLWFYGGYGRTYSGLRVPGFVSEKTGQQVVFFTNIDSETIKLTYQATQNGKLELTELLSRKYQPYRGASAFVPLEASEDQNSLDQIGPVVKWNYILSQHMTIDAGFNRAGYWWPDVPWTSDVRRVDLTTTQTRGAFLAQNRTPVRWGWNGAWNWFTELRGMSHEVKSGALGYRGTTGIDYTGYPNQQIYQYRSLTNEADYFLHPDSVQVLDYPNDVISGTTYNGWFLNDNVGLSRKLTLNAGIRFDRYSSWLPAQGNPGTGPFAEKLLYPENHNFPAYNALSPRLSLIYDVTGTNRVALKGSYGRYAASGSSITAASGPIAGSVNPAAPRVLTYTGWDGSVPYVPVPANLTSVTGGAGDLQINPNTKPASEDEFTTGIDLGLSRDVVLRVNAVRKLDFNESQSINVALPFGAYTDMRTGIDPGLDNIAGTVDDGIVDAWSVPRSNPNFRSVSTLFTNGARQDQYSALETTVNKRYGAGWSMLASYSLDHHTWQNNAPQNPNEARYAWALPETNQQVHLNGLYDRLPWGLKLSATYTAQSGAYFPRVVQVRDTLNQVVNVTVDGHAGRYDWVRLMNARASKVVRVGRHSIEGMVDVFNLLNSSVVLSQVNTNGPNYLKPLSSGNGAATAESIPAPRIFRLSLRWMF